MNDIDKFVAALVDQDTMAGTNRAFDENDIQTMKNMSSIEDVKQYAVANGLSSGKVNNALISAGLQYGADPLGAEDIAGLFGFGGTSSPALIGGLPSDYVPQNPTDTDFYYKDDEYRIFGNLPTEDLYKLQARLIQGGLLARGAFTPGDFDSATATAMRLVLGRQNRIGVKIGEKSTAWNEALLLYQNEPLPSGEEVSVYLPPDYAETATRIRNLFTQDLGRQPQPYELTLLAEQFMQDTQLRSQQSAELQELALGPSVQELESGNVGNKDIQGVVAQTGLQEISPTGRLYENFNNLVQREKDRLQANDDIQNTGRLMLGTILGTRR
tara:strand:+ start:700 stop:1680 length:981 start_codon:yes stop_codon:yes gene_type:complete